MSKYDKDVNRLLKAIKKGDTSKFDQLFECTANHLVGVARYYLVNKSYHDDVVADVYERILKYIHSYDESQDGYNWMCKITENVAHDYNEIYSKELALSELDSNQRAGADLRFDDAYLDLSRAFDTLDPDSRELLYQHFFFDRSYGELAKEYKVTKNAIKKRVDRILNKIRKFIDEGVR